MDFCTSEKRSIPDEEEAGRDKLQCEVGTAGQSSA